MNEGEKLCWRKETNDRLKAVNLPDLLLSLLLFSLLRPFRCHCSSSEDLSPPWLVIEPGVSCLTPSNILLSWWPVTLSKPFVHLQFYPVPLLISLFLSSVPLLLVTQTGNLRVVFNSFLFYTHNKHERSLS